jgi:hypothetical protein
VWVSLIVYLTVFITVLSGADYFFGIRRSIARARPAPGPGQDSPLPGADG